MFCNSSIQILENGSTSTASGMARSQATMALPVSIRGEGPKGLVVKGWSPWGRWDALLRLNMSQLGVLIKTTWPSNANKELSLQLETCNHQVFNAEEQLKL